jgi:hypothetical protein
MFTTNGYVKDGIKVSLEDLKTIPLVACLFMVGMCRNNVCMFVASVGAAW